MVAEVRSTHFHSSLISAPGTTEGGAMSMPLNRVPKFTWSRFSDPGATMMLGRTAGRKLARFT